MKTAETVSDENGFLYVGSWNFKAVFKIIVSWHVGLFIALLCDLLSCLFSRFSRIEAVM